MLVSMQAAARGISGRFGLEVLGGVRRWGCGSWDLEVEGLWVRVVVSGFRVLRERRDPYRPTIKTES